MARLDTVTSPGAVLWLKERFEKGFRPEDKRLYFSMRIKTWFNTHLTQDQIDAMMAEMPPEIVAVEMGAEWPNYGSAYFPERYVDIAIDQDMYDDCYISLNPEKEGEKPKLGYEMEEVARIGTTKFSLSYIPGNPRYVLFSFAVIAPLVARLLDSGRWRLLLAALVCLGALGSLGQARAKLEEARAWRALVSRLEAEGVRHCYSDFYQSARITFLSEERVLCSSKLGPTTTEYFMDSDDDPQRPGYRQVTAAWNSSGSGSRGAGSGT